MLSELVFYASLAIGGVAVIALIASLAALRQLTVDDEPD